MTPTIPEQPVGRFWPMLWLALSGLLQAAGLAWPFRSELGGFTGFGLQFGEPQPYAHWLGVVVLVKVLTQASGARQAMWWTWWSATVAGASTFWWLYVSMAHYGGVPSWLAVIAVVLLAWALATYCAFFCGLLFVRMRTFGFAHPAALFAAMWLLTEWARGILLTGFPWGNAATAYVQGLGVLAPWVGALGVGAVAAGMAAWLALTPWTWESKGSVASALLVSLLVVSPKMPWADADWSGTRAGLTSTVTLLQGNIDQADKFNPQTGIPKALGWYQSQLMNDTADLVIAPETAIPLLQTQLEPDYWQTLWRGLAQGKHAALFGVPVVNAQGGYENAAWLISPDQAQHLLQTSTHDADLWPAGYSKIHLVPFGEYTPWGFRWFAGMLGMPLNGFTSGAMSQRPHAWAGQRWGVQICYEDVFGAELAERMRQTAPTVWVNLSNIAWFGNTVAVPQHLNIARWRAREMGRSVVRATNTGATVVINHLGQVQAQLKPYTRGVLTAQVTGREGLTPYVRWLGLWSDLPLVLLAFGVVAIGAWRQLR